MKIKPILGFRAVVAGSCYPKTFSTEDEFDVDSDEAATALELGCLSDDDANMVRKARELSVPGDGDDAPSSDKADQTSDQSDSGATKPKASKAAEEKSDKAKS